MNNSTAKNLILGAGFLLAGCSASDADGPGGSMTGLPGTGGSNGSPAACIADPSEVVIIGDSYVTGAASPALQPTLAGLYPTASSFRNYAIAGTSMATGGLPLPKIPEQFDQAVAADPNIILGIQDGGGNDILICDAAMFPNCSSLCNQAGSSTQQVCRDIVDTALETADALMVKAANLGVKDVIFFFYPHIPLNNGGYTEILDYGEPLARAKCEGAEAATGGKLRCHFVSLVEPFANAGGDRNPANFVADQIHPSQAGQDIIAKEIYDVMQANCLGQTSGCCTP